MCYTIFGLGDTSYEQFNEIGIQFDKGFEQLGAKRLYDMGVANAEHHTTEDDF
jgi:NADPH-ferrihemoprotein reductase